MESRLFECKVDHTPAAIHPGVVMGPFIPKPGDVCTLVAVVYSGDYLFEEVSATFYGQPCAFMKYAWKEISDLPDLTAITEMVEECQLQELI